MVAVVVVLVVLVVMVLVVVALVVRMVVAVVGMRTEIRNTTTNTRTSTNTRSMFQVQPHHKKKSTNETRTQRRTNETDTEHCQASYLLLGEKKTEKRRNRKATKNLPNKGREKQVPESRKSRVGLRPAAASWRLDLASELGSMAAHLWHGVCASFVTAASVGPARMYHPCRHCGPSSRMVCSCGPSSRFVLIGVLPMC